jgi:hypothetical protein
MRRVPKTPGVNMAIERDSNAKVPGVAAAQRPAGGATSTDFSELVLAYYLPYGAAGLIALHPNGCPFGARMSRPAHLRPATSGGGTSDTPELDSADHCDNNSDADADVHRRRDVLSPELVSPPLVLMMRARVR